MARMGGPTFPASPQDVYHHGILRGRHTFTGSLGFIPSGDLRGYLGWMQFENALC